MKSRVGYPKKPFETLEEAQAWVNRFAQRYHEEQRHSSLNWVTPMASQTGAERELLRRHEETYRKAQQCSGARLLAGRAVRAASSLAELNAAARGHRAGSRAGILPGGVCRLVCRERIGHR
jgi:hypothetical protein